MKILMNQGEHFYLDTIDIDMCYDKEKRKKAHITSVIDKVYLAYGFNWPYFSYATQFNYILIYNAFNVNFVQRYALPPHTVRCSQTFLADSHDMYCIIETTNRTYELYLVNLDDAEPYMEGPLVSYPFSLVKDQPLTSFHVRSSSEKEKINLNRSLICFMMHGNCLYGWCKAEG